MCRLIAAVIYYEEAWTLERCLSSIRRAAPHAGIVTLDGAYAQFPHPTGRPESEDGSNVIADRLADTVVRCPKDADGRPRPWASEIEKRSEYLKHAQTGDLILVVDADEEVRGLVPQQIEGNVFDVRHERDDGIPPGAYLRFFRKQDGMLYRGTHNAVTLSDGTILNANKRPTVPGFYLYHHYLDRGMRDVARNLRKARYYDFLCRDEAEFRKTHVLL